MDTKRIIKEYYEQLSALKFHNLDKMGQFLENIFYQNSHNTEINLIGLYVLKECN